MMILLLQFSFFFFTGPSLAFGAGGLTKPKLSMDLKQRLTEVLYFLTIKTTVYLHCHKYEEYSVLRWALFICSGFQCEQRKCGHQDKDRTSYR